MQESGKEPETVAVIGTGIMGSAMARNLVRAGFTTVVWDRSAQATEALAADGARVAAAPDQAVGESDVVITRPLDERRCGWGRQARGAR
jgi:3-hydroxyisobutyrate dehydrogenase